LASEADKAKSETAAKGGRKPGVVNGLLELASGRREEGTCASGIGQVMTANDTEIVVGFRQECKHLAAAISPRSTASSFFSDFFFDDVVEEEITPRRSKQRRRRGGGRCDESGFCTAMAEPPIRSLRPRNDAPRQSRSRVAASASFWKPLSAA
jgi:hypothetical protein